MTLTDRRRALMAKRDGAVIPSGYVTEGLVFFLDANQLASDTKWTDIIMRKQFDLTDCQKTANGILFDQATSVGVCPGQITSDLETETIETVFTAADTRTGGGTIKNKAILCQPYANDAVGISLRFGDNGAGVRCAIGLDGVKRAIMQFSPFRSSTEQYVHAISVNGDRCVFNGTKIGGSSQTSYSKNSTGDTVLGAVATSSVSGRNLGTIHAVRIYNRKLTESEMKANQARDLVYYGLS